MDDLIKRRLADAARNEGSQVFIESATEETFVTSGIMPGVLYRVTRDACSCQGHTSFGRCKHRALLLAWLRENPPEPDPDDEALAIEPSIPASGRVPTPRPGELVAYLAVRASAVQKRTRALASLPMSDAVALTVVPR